MTRREALTWMEALGITAATAGNLFTQAGSVMAATPKKAGKITNAADLHGPSDAFDPGLNTSNIDYVRGRSNYKRVSVACHWATLVATSGLSLSGVPTPNPHIARRRLVTSGPGY